MKLAHKKASNWDFLEEVELDISDQLKQFILNTGGKVVIEYDGDLNKKMYGNEWVIEDYDDYLE